MKLNINAKRLISVICCIALLITALPIALSVSADSLTVNNSSFDSGENIFNTAKAREWDLLQDGNNTQDYIKRQENVKRSGDAAIKVDSRQNAGSVFQIATKTDFTVTKGNWYILSYYVKGESGAAVIKPQINAKSPERYISYDNYAVSSVASNNWTQVRVPFFADSYTELDFTLIITGAGVMYVDDVKLEAMPTNAADATFANGDSNWLVTKNSDTQVSTNNAYYHDGTSSLYVDHNNYTYNTNISANGIITQNVGGSRWWVTAYVRSKNAVNAKAYMTAEVKGKSGSGQDAYTTVTGKEFQLNSDDSYSDWTAVAVLVDIEAYAPDWSENNTLYIHPTITITQGEADVIIDDVTIVESAASRVTAYNEVWVLDEDFGSVTETGAPANWTANGNVTFNGSAAVIGDASSSIVGRWNTVQGGVNYGLRVTGLNQNEAGTVSVAFYDSYDTKISEITGGRFANGEWYPFDADGTKFVAPDCSYALITLVADNTVSVDRVRIKKYYDPHDNITSEAEQPPAEIVVAKPTITVSNYAFSPLTRGAAATLNITAQADLAFGAKDYPTINLKGSNGINATGVKLIKLSGKAPFDWGTNTANTVEYSFKIPEYLVGGTYQVEFVIGDSTASLGSVAVSDAIMTKTTAEVNLYGQTPLLEINGETAAPMFWMTPDEASAYKSDYGENMYASGVGLTAVRIGNNDATYPFWISDNTYDFTQLDAKIYSVLQGQPNAKLLIQLDTTPPDWWFEANSGKDGIYYKDGQKYLSFSSSLWREDVLNFLDAAYNHISNANYSSQLIGVLLTGGTTYEWQWWGNSLNNSSNENFKNAVQPGFRAWLTAKYGTDSALQAAWGNGETLANATVPDENDDSANAYSALVGAYGTIGQKYFDYNDFLSETVTDAIHTFTDAIANKEAELGVNWLLGTYYGYVTPTSTYEANGTGSFELEKILTCDNLDFITSPYNYGVRESGSSAGYMGMVDSIHAAGKLFIMEADNRTSEYALRHYQSTGFTTNSDNSIYLSYNNDQYDSYGQTYTVEESLNQLRRDFANVITKGGGIWWYDMAGSTYDDDEFYEFLNVAHDELEIGKENEIDNPDVAWIIDDDMFKYSAYNFDANHAYLESVIKYQQEELAHIGTGYDMYYMSALENGYSAPNKVFIITGIDFDDAEIAVINKLKANGNILIFTGLAGFYKDGKVADMSSLIGMTMATSTDAMSYAVTINSADVGVATYGDPTDTIVTPIAYVTGGYDTALGTIYGTENIGLAIKNNSNYSTIYSSVGASSAVIRYAMEKAGAHSYVDSKSDVVFSGTGYLAIDSQFGGERTITLNGLYSVYDVYNGKYVSYGAESFVDNFRAGETKLYRLDKTVVSYDGTFEDASIISENLGGWVLQDDYNKAAELSLTDGKGGGKAIMMTNNASTTGVWVTIASPWFATKVTAGKTYNYSFDGILVNKASYTGEVKGVFYDANGYNPQVVNFTNANYTSSDWTTNTGSFTVPTGAETLEFRIMFQGEAGTSLKIDNLEIRPTGVAASLEGWTNNEAGLYSDPNNAGISDIELVDDGHNSVGAVHFVQNYAQNTEHTNLGISMYYKGWNPTGTYVFSAWIKGNTHNAGDAATLEIAWNSGTWANTGTASQPIEVNSNEWQQVSYEFTLNNAGWVPMAIRCGGYVGADFYIDDIVVYEKGDVLRSNVMSDYVTGKANTSFDIATAYVDQGASLKGWQYEGYYDYDQPGIRDVDLVQEGHDSIGAVHFYTNNSSEITDRRNIGISHLATNLPAGNYVFSAWIKGYTHVDNANGLGVELAWGKGTWENGTAAQPIYVNTNGEWQKVEYNFTVSKADWAPIIIYVGGYAVADFLIDDICIYQKDDISKSNMLSDHSGNFVTNMSFDADATFEADSGSGWTVVTPGTEFSYTGAYGIEFVTSKGYSQPGAMHLKHIYADQSAGGANGIGMQFYKSFSTTAGQKYVLTAWVNGNSIATTDDFKIELAWGGGTWAHNGSAVTTNSSDFIFQTGTEWKKLQYTFTASTTYTTLYFIIPGYSNIDFYMDDISVYEVGASEHINLFEGGDFGNVVYKTASGGVGGSVFSGSDMEGLVSETVTGLNFEANGGSIQLITPLANRGQKAIRVNGASSAVATLKSETYTAGVGVIKVTGMYKSEGGTPSVNLITKDSTINIDLAANTIDLADGWKYLEYELNHATGGDFTLAFGAQNGSVLFDDMVFSIPAAEKGDANGDGSLDIRDMVKMNNYVKDNSVSINNSAADIDENDSIEVADISELRKYLLKLASILG